ncbi:hypothetical protein PR048_013679 [Dryococelus australis]|uniref:DDE Tnp4 domain-containing protein n=1 Tax=Dryococelus australis TaxID=614101 RepID=A0ABQ9HSV4_9NEOP|nr:hypothetical protein PR048_013679 [Dryococelus australis]
MRNSTYYHDNHSLNCMGILWLGSKILLCKYQVTEECLQFEGFAEKCILCKMEDVWPIPYSVILADSGYALKEWHITRITEEDVTLLELFARQTQIHRKYIQVLSDFTHLGY